MTGDPVTPFLVEIWSAGPARRPRGGGLRALRENATGTPPADSPYNGRAGNRGTRERGYIPTGARRARDKGGDNDCQHPASATLEYAAADAALALMAAGARPRRRRAGCSPRAASGYRNAVGPRGIRHVPPAHGRRHAGSTPYDPATGAGQFHEGGAYQYQWLVPQDPAGLVAPARRPGGGRGAARRLLRLRQAAARPGRRPRARDWVEHPYDYYGAVTYNPNNEPDLHAPYMYAWTGQPWKTATVVRAARDAVHQRPGRHDRQRRPRHDVGLVRAQLARASIPTMSGADFFVLSTPQFPHAVRLARDDRLAPGRDAHDRRARARAPIDATSPRRASTAAPSGARG